MKLRTEYTTEELAAGFWASPFGQEVLQGAPFATLQLMAYLTTDRAQGGLQSAWDDHEGLLAVRDHIIRTKPERPPPS